MLRSTATAQENLVTKAHEVFRCELVSCDGRCCADIKYLTHSAHGFVFVSPYQLRSDGVFRGHRT